MSRPSGDLLFRLAILGVVVLIAGWLLYSFRDQLQLDELARRETEFRGYYAAHPWLTLAAAFLGYVVVTGLSLPGAAAMSVFYGWLFGFWRALVLVSFASTAGATIAFLLSRYVIGEAIQARYGDRLAALNAAVERDGAFYLLTLRLIPQVPFFVINVAMGLTKLRAWTFWWVSQVGMLPGTIIFVLAGASAPSLQQIADQGLTSLLDWRLVTALTLLGATPLLIRWTLRMFGQRATEE
ncbi:MAG TPA: VTT domain-containing protein [Pirellulaceae bacterium]|nr:VTT domain-containing protein [Pirellulaceae bacterium]